MVGALQDGAGDPQIEGVEVVVRPALGATAVDVLEADGYVLCSPANLGYLAGAMKHFFDQVYYPCLEATVGRPYGVALHGNDDVTGARRRGRDDHDRAPVATGGLGGRGARQPDTAGPRRRARELGATIAAGLDARRLTQASGPRHSKIAANRSAWAIASSSALCVCGSADWSSGGRLRCAASPTVRCERAR